MKSSDLIRELIAAGWAPNRVRGPHDVFHHRESLDEATSKAEEAIAAWIAALDAGEMVPTPTDLKSLRTRPEFAGWIYGIVAVDPASFDDKSERVNIAASPIAPPRRHGGRRRRKARRESAIRRRALFRR
jgi:hypothetical protein